MRRFRSLSVAFRPPDSEGGSAVKHRLPFSMLLICFLQFLTIGCSGSSLLPTRNLVAYYPFNGDARDVSGNGRHGSPSGGVTWTADRFGNPGRAADFNGRDASISIDDPDQAMNFDANSHWYSVSCWVKLDALPRNRDMEIMIDRGTSEDSPASYDIFYRGSLGSFVADVWDGTINIIVPSKTKPVPDVWYHLVMVADRERIRLYVNGKRELSYDGASWPESIPPRFKSTFNTQKLRTIGDFKPEWVNGHHYFNGVIDDVRVYSLALTEDEILSLYHEKDRK